MSRAELNGTQLRVEGSGAVPNATVTIDGGAASGPADGSGAFRIQKDPFSSPSCVITIADGTNSLQKTLSGCVPQAPPPPPTPGVPAPSLLLPLSGASVVEPVMLSWSAVTAPTAIIDYFWELATSSTFGPTLVARGVTSFPADGIPPPTQDTFSGLPNAAYFWRVQAVAKGVLPTDGTIIGPWSAVRSLVVTGQAAGTPATPTITGPAAPANYHPLESFKLTWTAAAGATQYQVELNSSSTFSPDTSLTKVQVPGTSFSTPLFGFTTPLFIRVRGVSSTGVLGLPSPTLAGAITYNAPIPPAPSLLAPADGATAPLPVTFDWSDDPNPQTGGYELQISSEPTFANGAGCGSIELCVRSITPSTYTVSSLTAGTKFWRVRSYHGDSAPGIAAVTALSIGRSFVVAAVQPTILSLTIDVYGGGGTVLRSHTNSFSGRTADNLAFGTVQLSGPAPVGGAVVSLATSTPIVSLPATVTVPGGEAVVSFPIDPLQVLVSTPTTLSAAYAGATVSAPFTVDPPNMSRLDIGAGAPVPNIFSGGITISASIFFNGIPPPGSVIALSSSSPFVQVPASVTADQFGAHWNIVTSQVAATAAATVTATWKGQSVSNSLTLHPPPTLLAPANGVTFAAGQTVVFDWADFVPNLASWDIQIASSSSFATPIIDQSTSTLSTFSSSTLPSGTVFWRVRGRDVYGNPGPWSEVRTIVVTVPAGPLPAPMLGFPTADARVLQGQTVAFTWGPVAGAASYTLQVDDSSSFTTPLILNQNVVGTQVNTSTLPTATLWWRVRANDGAGSPGAWSQIRRLDVR